MTNLTDTERIKVFIEHEYPCDEIPKNLICGPSNKAIKDSIYQLWETFQNHDLQDPTFVNEFTSGCRERSLERYSEMLFAWYFIQLGFSPTSNNEGPDLRIEHNGRVIWIEIITPRLNPPLGNGVEAQKAVKAIEDYLAPPPTDPKQIRAIDIPTEQILLRWTAALKEKREKLTGDIKNGGKSLGYLEKGIVKTDDIYVIAINSTSLGHHGFIGKSQYPNPVEATFAVGPIQVIINRETAETINSGPSFRPNVINHNQSRISTESFLNPDYKEISALIATHASLESAVQPYSKLPLLVHNPYALNPLPRMIFRATAEYVADHKGDFWEIKNIVSD